MADFGGGDDDHSPSSSPSEGAVAQEQRQGDNHQPRGRKRPRDGSDDENENGDDDDGDVDVQSKANRLYRGESLAPMVRASTTPLRCLALDYGADFVYTEELVDRSILETVRVENEALGTIDYIKDRSKLSKKVQKRLDREGLGPPVILRIDPAKERDKLICQLGTGEAESAVQAAFRVRRDVAAIDVNMGCPKKFSVSGGMGSALLEDVDRACAIIRSLRDAMRPFGIPVSAKIRLLPSMPSMPPSSDDGGADTSSSSITRTVEFISSLIERGGANAVAVHGRRPGDEATRAADWDTLERVVRIAKGKYPNVPILINGDFYTRHEFTQFLAKTGANGVLLARPALYNTSIFQKPTTTTTRTTSNGENNTDGGRSSCTAAAETAMLLSPSSSPCCSYGYKSPLLLDRTEVVQDYLRRAVRYDTNYKNVKYVLCEMMNNRRTPTQRVPYLPQNNGCFAEGRSISTTCACRSLQDICKLWDVVPFEKSGASTSLKASVTTATASSSATSNSEKTPELVEQAPAVEHHKYSDSYFLGTPSLPSDNNNAAPANNEQWANNSGGGGGNNKNSLREEEPTLRQSQDDTPAPSKKARVASSS